MPQIIVTAGASTDRADGTVMLRERVNASDFESERFTTNLLERLGWAIEDATEAERHTEREPIPEPLPEPEPDWDPTPVGVA